jgi:predicted TIM-barrel fold metal-dependent hydrolase
MDAGDLIELRDELEALRIPFVIDHMGRVDAAGGLDQPAFRALLEQVRRENCWVKVSGSDRVSAEGAPFLDALPFAQQLIAAAPERVVWGTDFPHSNPRHPVEDEATLLDLLPMMTDDAGLHRLLVTNPERLYSF